MSSTEDIRPTNHQKNNKDFLDDQDYSNVLKENRNDGVQLGETNGFRSEETILNGVHDEEAREDFNDSCSVSQTFLQDSKDTSSENITFEEDVANGVTEINDSTKGFEETFEDGTSESLNNEEQLKDEGQNLQSCDENVKKPIFVEKESVKNDQYGLEDHSVDEQNVFNKTSSSEENAEEVKTSHVPESSVLSYEYKDDSNSISMDVSLPASQDGFEASFEQEKDDEDPDALMIDTGRWSGGEEVTKCDGVVEGEKNDKPLSEESEPVPQEDLKKAQTNMEVQQPSDDDIDPDALTIDTAPFDEEAKYDMNHSNQESNSRPELKITLPIGNLVKKAVMKRSRKNVNRLGKNLNKGTKKRVPKMSSPNALRCPRCPLTSFLTVPSLLKHQRSCGSLCTPAPSPVETPKVPRKVYMCSACGSYFESWNLFLHMKEVHKRSICLHCLGMFTQSAKLIQHLATKHGVVDHVLEYGDQLSQRFPGPQLLLCSRCDVMCTDQDFESHTCSTICSHCGLSGTHYPTCRLAPPMMPRPIKPPKRRARAPKRPRKPVQNPSSIANHPAAEAGAEFPLETNNPADQLSPTTHQEKMMQLYRKQERSFSTLESIEESINRVVDSLAVDEEEEEEEEEEKITNIPETIPQPEPEIVEDIKEEEEEEEEEAVVPEEDTELQQPAPVSPPKFNHHSESSDSEKLTIELEPWKRFQVSRPEIVDEPEQMILAGEEVPFTCVPLPEPLDRNRVPTAMKLFVRATSLTCVYCAHARKIAVNARQLGLHQLAQHRYVTIAESTPLAEKIVCHTDIVRVIKDTLPSLENIYFNAYGFDSADKTAWRSADRVYECFHCSYITPDQREFSMHNRKLHSNEMKKRRQTETHLCIMCKTRFLTYSELLCHLCRGVYVSGEIIDPNCRYRCYCCDIEPLPSSFRLMVHLRQTHTACDMCFTLCDSQAGLFSHIMKHKSLYYCYACALTYETKKELSKHTFWKHGAESVTCKRCLQKKLKHEYHFCLPPPGFTCDNCGSWFKTAATLRVHSRLHTGEYPHACTECSEKFISKKLLVKHAVSHTTKEEPIVNGETELTPQATSPSNNAEEKKSKKKAKKDFRDLFDLPPVNLSESDDSSGDEISPQVKEEVKKEEETVLPTPVAGPSSEPIEEAPVTVWDNVLASLEEKEKGRSYPPDSPFFNLPSHRVAQIMLADHDSYCRPHVSANGDARVDLDHDYCNNGMVSKPPGKHTPRKQNKQRRNRSSSSDSSSSSSSSHSCGSSCSCSSSSESTESAVDTDGEHLANSNKTEKQRRTSKKVIKVQKSPEPSVEVCEIQIQESDLETDEQITDDDQFYEINPALRASEVLRLNRSMLLDKLEGGPSPSQPPATPRQNGKSKKKRSNHSNRASSSHNSHHYNDKYSSSSKPRSHGERVERTPSLCLTDDSNVGDSDGRRPRRKRVPLKFYGFSSGDDEDLAPMPPRKKERVIEHNTTTPAVIPEPVPEPSNLYNSPAWRPPPEPPRVHPIKIRTGALKQTFAKSNNSDEFHIKRAELGGFHVNGGSTLESDKNEKLYCFCQCPYDEVSEMIACDAHDCAIEWFHFECVGIMDPPKGKWYCPDCKKKAAAESEMMSIPLR